MDEHALFYYDIWVWGWFLQQLHKFICSNAHTTAPVTDDTHVTLWYGLFKLQAEQVAAVYIALGEVRHDGANAEISHDELGNHIAGRQLEFGLQSHALMTQECVNIWTCACVVFQTNDRKLVQIVVVQSFALKIWKPWSGDEDVLNLPCLLDLHVRIGGKRTGDDTEVYVAWEQMIYSAGSRSICDMNLDPRI